MNGPFAPAAALPGAPTHAMPSVIRACRPSEAVEQIIAYAAAHGIRSDGPGDRRFAGGARAGRSRLGRHPTQPTAVLVCRLADFLLARPAQPRMPVTERLEPDWEEAFQRSRPNSADPSDRPDDLGRQPAPGLCRRCR